MNPLPRPARQPTLRPPRIGLADTPRQRSRAARQAPVRAALQYTLSITTAASEAELTDRTVEAAGRLTGATVACGFDTTGGGHTWGESPLATAVLAECAGLLRHDQAYVRSDRFARLGLPAAIATRDEGMLVAVAAREPDRFGHEEENLLSLVVAHASAGRQRLRQLAVLSHLADRDPLTGLRHYRPFEERLGASMPDRTAVLAIDIDNFKEINDSRGHQAGDEALVTLVAAMGRALRGDDHIYRIGGDEFAIVVDVAGPAEVDGITRRILRAARAAGYPISVGAALRRPAESGRETLLRADRALYQAKREGRNTARLAA